MNGPEPLLERRRAHRSGGHHIRSRLDIRTILERPHKVFLDQSDPLHRDPLAHRVIEWRAIGLQAMRERVHARACCNLWRHANGQFRIADRHFRHHSRMENHLFRMRRFLCDHTGAAHFRARSRSRRYRDHRCNPLRIGPRPPIANILEIPHRARLSRHEGDHFSRIKPRSATECDHTIMLSRPHHLEPGIDIRLDRIRLDLREHRPAEPCSLQRIQNSQRHRLCRQKRISHQKRPHDPVVLAELRQLRDFSCAKTD